MSLIKVSDYIFRVIATETDADTVFMLPGGGYFKSPRHQKAAKA